MKKEKKRKGLFFTLFYKYDYYFKKRKEEEGPTGITWERCQKSRC